MTINLTTLENGLRVVSCHMPSVESVTLGMWIRTGTRFEKIGEQGISHLLEHMAFKGTDSRSARDIAEEIEAVGGHLNAHTSREFTAYFATVLKEHSATAFEILADILSNSTFDEEELARERTVVLQEIGEANDTPDDVVFDRLQETAFPDQPLGWPVLGTADSVTAMPRGALVEYMANHYRGPRMVLAAAGNIEHGALLGMAERAFSGLLPDPPPSPRAADYKGGDFREARELEQAHLVVAFPGLSYGDDEYYAASVFNTILGGGMSSRLFQEIRENRGLAYSVYSFMSSYEDSGLFGIYSATADEYLPELTGLIVSELGKMADKVSDAEMARARAQLKSGLLMSLESSHARCEQIARQVHIFGRVLSVDEIVGKVESVSPRQVTDVAGRILAGAPTLSALGAIGSLTDYDTLAAGFRA